MLPIVLSLSREFEHVLSVKFEEENKRRVLCQLNKSTKSPDNKNKWVSFIRDLRPEGACLIVDPLIIVLSAIVCFGQEQARGSNCPFQRPVKVFEKSPQVERAFSSSGVPRQTPENTDRIPNDLLRKGYRQRH